MAILLLLCSFLLVKEAEGSGGGIKSQLRLFNGGKAEDTLGTKGGR